VIRACTIDLRRVTFCVYGIYIMAVTHTRTYISANGSLCQANRLYKSVQMCTYSVSRTNEPPRNGEKMIGSGTDLCRITYSWRSTTMINGVQPACGGRCQSQTQPLRPYNSFRRRYSIITIDGAKQQRMNQQSEVTAEDCSQNSIQSHKYCCLNWVQFASHIRL